jgi:hypothetical protein
MASGQAVRRLTLDQEIVGSNPTSPAMKLLQQQIAYFGDFCRFTPVIYVRILLSLKFVKDLDEAFSVW